MGIGRRGGVQSCKWTFKELIRVRYAGIVVSVESLIVGDYFCKVGNGCSHWSNVRGRKIHNILGRVSELPIQGRSEYRLKSNQRCAVVGKFHLESVNMNRDGCRGVVESGYVVQYFFLLLLIIIGLEHGCSR